jgi:methylated-DNA-[protein]-cysteine S-methyltransferase
MQNSLKYTIFETKWGYFGIAGCGKRILRTHLPAKDHKIIESYMLSGLPNALYEKNFLFAAQQRIKDYFQGTCLNFSDIDVDLSGFTPFTREVLQACREITYGRTITYRQLAEIIRKPASSRPVGSALAGNQIPLIIPCHRVICSDGRIGGFSANGPADLKRRLIAFESGNSGDK